MEEVGRIVSINLVLEGTGRAGLKTHKVFSAILEKRREERSLALEIFRVN